MILALSELSHFSIELTELSSFAYGTQTNLHDVQTRGKTNSL